MAVITSSPATCLLHISDDFDVVILMTGLFGATIFTQTKEAMLAVYFSKLWETAIISSICRFSVINSTKEEIIAEIGRVFPGIQIKEE